MKVFVNCHDRKMIHKGRSFVMDGGATPPFDNFKCEKCGNQIQVFVENQREERLIETIRQNFPEIVKKSTLLNTAIELLREEMEKIKGKKEMPKASDRGSGPDVTWRGRSDTF